MQYISGKGCGRIAHSCQRPRPGGEGGKDNRDSKGKVGKGGKVGRGIKLVARTDVADAADADTVMAALDSMQTAAFRFGEIINHEGGERVMPEGRLAL